MKKNILFLLWIITLLLSSSQLASTNFPLNRFGVDGYQKILNLNQGKTFLMVLWSVSCPPCIEELFLLGEFHQQYPGASIVLVSTDTVIQQEEINQLMHLHDLGDVQQWVFDSDSTQAIRYAVDPIWYGELPRSYFHSGNDQRHALSGRLDKDILLTWFEVTDNSEKGL